MHFSFAVGAFVAPLVVRWSMLQYAGRYDVSFYVFGGSLILGSVLLFLRPSPTHRSEVGGAGGKDEGGEGDGEGGGGSGGEGGFDAAAASKAGEGASSSSSSSSSSTSSSSSGGCCASRRSRVGMFIASVGAFLGVYVGLEVCYGGYIVAYATMGTIDPSLGGPRFTAPEAQIMASGYWGAIALGRLAAIGIAQKLSPLKMLALDIGGVIVCVAALVACRYYMECVHGCERCAWMYTSMNEWVVAMFG